MDSGEHGERRTLEGDSSMALSAAGERSLGKRRVSTPFIQDRNSPRRESGRSAAILLYDGARCKVLRDDRSVCISDFIWCEYFKPFSRTTLVLCRRFLEGCVGEGYDRSGHGLSARCMRR